MSEKPTGILADISASQPLQRAILIVNDDALTRRLMNVLLSRLDGNVVCQEAADGAEALDLLLADARRYALVLLNFRMPRLDGLEVLEEMQRDGRRFPPVVLYSASDDPALRLMAARKGACAFFSVPFHPDELCSLVRQLLNPG